MCAMINMPMLLKFNALYFVTQMCPTEKRPQKGLFFKIMNIFYSTIAIFVSGLNVKSESPTKSVVLSVR